MAGHDTIGSGRIFGATVFALEVRAKGSEGGVVRGARGEQFIAGRWFRFDRYQLENGFIRPARGASLQSYDPFEMYERSKKECRGKPPYQTLLDLLSHLGADVSKNHPRFAIGAIPYTTAEYEEAEAIAEAEGSPVEDKIDAEMNRDYICYDIKSGFTRIRRKLRSLRPRMGIGLTPLSVCGTIFEPGPEDLELFRKRAPLPPETGELILSWCARFGLLGVLPHVAESVTHCARWTLGERYNPELQFMAETIQHYRAHGRWFTKVLPCSFDGTENLGKPKEGEPLPRAPGYIPRCPGARMRHIEVYGEETGLTEEGLLETWCDFFPSIPKSERLTHTYPQPLTAGFWRIYEEPLEVFLRHALIFLYAVSSSPQYLQTLLEPVGISLERKKDGRVGERWCCPSLLSAFAKMAAQDLSGGGSILRCPACGGVFVSSAYQAVYCSEPCAWRHRKRRAREATQFE
jgi:hypothetical protein